MRLPLPFTSYETRAPRGGVQRLVNCYPEKGQKKDEIILYGDPGITTEATLPKYPQRGAIKFQGVLHVVAGNTLYRVSSGGNYAALGTIPGTGYTPMAENGAQLVVVAEPDAYVLSGGTLAQITDDDFTARGARDCVFLDNYILFVEPGSGRFFGSALGDATDYDSLDFATAEAYPDIINGIDADHGQIFLAGPDSCEIWDNVGGSGFPFARNFNGVVEQGCAAGRSIVKADQTVFWIDNIGMARRLDGITPVRVSTHGVEQAWSEYATLEDAEGFSLTFDGHIWVVFHFPTADRTWVYDVTSSQWHEKESWNRNSWRVAWAINVYGGVWCGDRDSGKIGKLDPDVYTEFSDTMVSTWTYPSVWAEKKTAFHREMELIMETGVGGINVDPQVMMEVSDDGGQTWHFLPNRGYGKQGNYRTVVTWSRLGSSPDRVYRGSISDNYRRAILGTFLDVAQGVY